jgi:signal transduction histidine kinase
MIGTRNRIIVDNFQINYNDSGLTFENLTFVIILFLLALIFFHFYRRNYRKKLEEKYSTQTNELIRAKEKAESAQSAAAQEHTRLIESDKIKTDLLSILAHDLKSPLISIKMLSKIIIEESDKRSPVADYASDIFSTAQRVHNLVDEILDSAIIESGILALDKKPVDIGKLAELVVLDNIIIAQQKDQKIIFKRDEECIIEGDEARLRAIVDNLLSNAIKYSQLGKGIWVTVKNIDNDVRMEVKDEGSGLTEDDLKKIFGKFQRLSTQPTAGEPSTGLGLFIVNQLVGLHNGSVAVKSELGKGTVFTITIPKKME